MQVRWTRPAAEDLERIARHIAQENPTAARQVAKTVYDRCMGLELFPNRGRIGRIAGTRESVLRHSRISPSTGSRVTQPKYCVSITPLRTGPEGKPGSPFSAIMAA